MPAQRKEVNEMNENNNPGAVAPEAQPAAQPAQPAAPQPAQPAPVAQPAPAVPAAPVAPAAPAPIDDGRTGQQFDKLIESNKQLYEANRLLQEALAQRAQSNQTFAPINQPAAQPAQPAQPARQQYQQPQHQPQALQTPVAMPKATDFIETDPATGERYINQTKFEAAVADINQRASRAEQTVQQYIQQAEQREVERQNREAWSAYPELNPATAQFDARFSQQARAIIYDSMINPQDYGGRALGFKEAADFLKGGAPQQALPQQQVPTIDPAVAAAQQTAKEQASLAATPQPQQASQFVNNDDAYNRLVMGTRTGSDEALARRLLNAPHKLEDVEALQTR